MCGRKEDLIDHAISCQSKLHGKELPVCPECKSNDNVITNWDKSAMHQLFIAKPPKQYHCINCSFSF